MRRLAVLLLILVVSGCQQPVGEEPRPAPAPDLAAGPDWERLPAPTGVALDEPLNVERYEQTFPHLDVRREVSFVHDAKTLTSQGGARSYDVALYLVDHLYGEKAAKGVAAGLVIPWPPEPGTIPAIVVTPADVHE